MLFTFVLIQTQDFWIIFMLSVSFWSIYTIYSGIWTRSNLIEFILCITTDSAVVAQVVSCYQGRQGWNWCQRNFFFFFFCHQCLTLICPTPYSFALLKTASFHASLDSSPQHSRFVVKLRFLAFVDCSCFFSYPSQCWRSTTFDRKTPACLDAGRQLDSIEKLPGGKVWTLTLVQVLCSVNRPRSCTTITCSNTDELLPHGRPVRRPLSPPPCQPVTLHSAFTAVPKLLCHH